MASGSSGVLIRPNNLDTLKISIKNNFCTLVFQTISIYDLDGDTPKLVHLQNYFIAPQGTNIIDFPLVLQDYDNSYDIKKLEVIYEPVNPNILVAFSFI
ncbi:MAG: hypothetical protein ACRDD2_02285 [Sarcina sp.]